MPIHTAAKPSLFLDRDGVLNTRIPAAYIGHPDAWNPAPDLQEAMAILSRVFGRIVVVTNQAGIDRGLITLEGVRAVHDHMLGYIQAGGGRIDAIFTCPHTRQEGCPCRKPATGMAFQAQNQFPDIFFENSFMVGDSLSDIEFGRMLGMQTVLIEGKEEELILLANAPAHFRYASLIEFARDLSAWKHWG